MATHATEVLIERDGVLVGPVRAPMNLHQQADNSIHNDAVARPLGFRGGTVAGIIHHEQFAPLLLRAFGPRWFERGMFSAYYTYATTDREPVQAFLRPTGADTAELWMEHESGTRVLEGDAAAGALPHDTGLRRRFEGRPEAGEVRIVAHLEPGALMPEARVRISLAEQERRRAVTTEPLDWYWQESPWGGPVCTPVTMFRLLLAGFSVRATITDVVGLYGGCELRVTDGPLFVERDYIAQGRILATGATPKSEVVWWDCRLREADSGREVAEMLMLHRFMKASSPRYGS